MKNIDKLSKLINTLFNIVILLNFIFCITTSSTFANSGSIDTSSIDDTLVKITQILLIIGGGVCVAKIIHIGIMFVLSSAAEKSSAKMALVPWLIGTIVCFGAAWIGEFVFSIFSEQKTKNVLEY